jgi:predicted nuclease of predicted toxin-antitoxin system
LKVLVDMNLTSRWVRFLADHGWEAKHWSEVGRAYDLDPVIMSYAKQHGFLVLTNDLDFGELLRTSGGTEPTVIQLRGEAIGPEPLGQAVVLALQKIHTALEHGYLITIDEHKARMRILPFALKD